MEKHFKELKQEFREMRTALERELRKEIRDVKTSLDFFNKQFEEISALCSRLEKENGELKAQNDVLKTDCSQLKQAVLNNERRTTALEQYSRNRNIEVKNVPFVEGERLTRVVQKIGEAVGESVKEDDIEICHRVTAKDASCPHIVVQFNNRSKRDAVLEKAKKLRLTTADIGFPGKTFVYVNEHLCPQLKKLLGQTVARKKEAEWRFAWTKGGKIFARKDEKSRVFQITTESDLEKIV
ncbi:hypothetical protein HPB51_025307 [Rhipicephalus microplus]|uniref:FP protein C-terminal domain-containing protein n=1 Tax=Rhipicephalus microplus TaxID=6941 RepID=A0A9J6F911_RHIMP|nr:hypothetical protein HPB51_025307 [Rhipicephalus microplus]